MSYAHQHVIDALTEARYWSQGMGLKLSGAIEEALYQAYMDAESCMKRKEKEQKDGEQTEDL